MLMLPNKDVWTFNAYEDRVELEESVYLAGSDGPRRTVQIVIYGHARKMPRVHWTFAIRAPAGDAAAARSPSCRWTSRNCRCRLRPLPAYPAVAKRRDPDRLPAQPALAADMTSRA